MKPRTTASLYIVSLLILMTLIFSGAPFNVLTRKVNAVALSGTNLAKTKTPVFARCWCSIRVNGTEVDKPAFDGYGDLEKNRCNNTCKALWDNSGPGNSELVQWANKLSGACGTVTLSMHANVGARNAEQVRSAPIETGKPCPPSTNWGPWYKSSSPDGVLEARASATSIQMVWKINMGNGLLNSIYKLGVCSKVSTPGILHVCVNNEKFTIPTTDNSGEAQMEVQSNKYYWIGVRVYSNIHGKTFIGKTIKIKTL